MIEVIRGTVARGRASIRERTGHERLKRSA